MSIFLRISRFGSPDTLMRLRGISSTLGYDADKLLSCTDIIEPLFSLHEGDNRYSLVANTERIRVNNAFLTPHVPITLESVSKFSVDRYTFTTLKSSSDIEILSNSVSSHSTSDDIEHNSNFESAFSDYQIQIKIGPLTRAYKLPLNSNISIGSSLQDSIYLNIEGIKQKHVTLEYDGKEIIYSGDKEAFSVKEDLLNGDSCITLHPINIHFFISRERSCS